MTLSAVFTADHFSIKSWSKYVKLNSLACEGHLCLKYSYAWYCKSDLVIAQHEEHAAYRGLLFFCKILSSPVLDDLISKWMKSFVNVERLVLIKTALSDICYVIWSYWRNVLRRKRMKKKGLLKSWCFQCPRIFVIDPVSTGNFKPIAQ